MNYLAHFYLSGDDENIIIGNYLGDFVRAREARELPPAVYKGLLLHRHIDTFTDSHNLVKESKKLFYPEFGKYAAVMVDVYFDYFLAKDWEKHTHLSLRAFSDEMYRLVGAHVESLPQRAKRFYNFMVKNDILYHYANKEGLQKVFNGLAFRASNDSKMEFAVRALSKQEIPLSDLFNEFFPQLEASCTDFKNQL